MILYIHIDIGIRAPLSVIELFSSSIINSHFKNGFIYVNEDEGIAGGIIINSSNFLNNTSEYGTVFNVKKLNLETGTSIKVNSGVFINNTASKFGGVIYSLGKYNNYHVELNTCKFNNNQAKLGGVVYGYSISSFPKISNIEQ